MTVFRHQVSPWFLFLVFSIAPAEILLPCWTMIWATCVLVDVSEYLDILTLEFSMTSVHLPFFTWV